jgi:hypothetical protein
MLRFLRDAAVDVVITALIALIAVRAGADPTAVLIVVIVTAAVLALLLAVAERWRARRKRRQHSKVAPQAEEAAPSGRTGVLSEGGRTDVSHARFGKDLDRAIHTKGGEVDASRARFGTKPKGKGPTQ